MNTLAGAARRIAVVTSDRRRVRHVAVWTGSGTRIGPLCRNGGYNDSWLYFPAEAHDWPADIAWCTRCNDEVFALYACVAS